MYIAAYRLFVIGMLCGMVYAPVLTSEMYSKSSHKQYEGAIPHLAQAYHLTGKTHYAKKAAVLLGCMAELYPFMHGILGF